MNKNTLVKPDLSKMHNAEFSQFLTRFFEDFAGSGIALDTDTTFKSLYESLKTKVTTYDKALEQVRGKEESKKISELDKVRDADMQALKDSIKPYRNAKTEAKQKAYHAIKLVLDNYKDVTKDTYEEEIRYLSSAGRDPEDRRVPQRTGNLQHGVQRAFLPPLAQRFAERGIQRKRPSQGAYRYIPTAFRLYNSQRTGERRGFLYQNLGSAQQQP